MAGVGVNVSQSSVGILCCCRISTASCENSLEKKLAACANIVSGVESIYRWQGKVERANEVLVIIKTAGTRLRELEREVKRLHSYDVPEFIAFPIVGGSKEYLKWIGENA